jgi:hypoxanthine phosphoribosyltransferase
MRRATGNAPDLERVLARSEVVHDAAAVAAAYDRLAAAVTARLSGEAPLVLAMMVGGMVPTAELVRRLRFPFQLDYLHATRYRGATSGRELRWLARPTQPLAGRCVLLVDDILDEGVTLAAVQAECAAQGAREVLTAVLTRKVHDRGVAGVRAEFIGLDVPDRYVFGCGMDYKEWFRDLPEVRAVAEGDA